jgi:hypothetical protein
MRAEHEFGDSVSRRRERVGLQRLPGTPVSSQPCPAEREKEQVNGR